ncbi:hypothetical protein [Lentzea sp. NPDC051838]|uniref:hypothetical protein n=1 Tax=Lentzea sp. NPDC051838 TaxID=3154849 RepID=UPI003425044F
MSLQMPPRLMTAALLHWFLAVASCALAAVTAVGRSISEDSVLWGAWYGSYIAFLGLINVFAVLGLYRQNAPEVTTSRLASGLTFLQFGNALQRSVLREGFPTVPGVLVAVIAVLCVVAFVLTFGPRVKHWKAANRR